MPKRKALHAIGNFSADVVFHDVKQVALKQELEIKALDKRRDQEMSGIADNLANFQPATAPEPYIGMRIDVLLNYVDENDQ